jgi:hypothetical protein
VAVPGLHFHRLRLDGLNRIVRGRLTSLRGVARLVHIHMALALPENNPWYHGSGDGPPDSFRGTSTRPPADWDGALRRTFGTQSVSVDGVPQTVLPMDEDRTRYLIEDPYGWINAMLGNGGGGGGRGWGRPRGDDISLKMVSGSSFDDVYEVKCSQKDLHIPRKMAWAVEPRSREYMNMDCSPAELFELYFASLERRVEDERPDYSDESMRLMGAPLRSQAAGHDDEEDYDDEDDYDEEGSLSGEDGGG